MRGGGDGWEELRWLVQCEIGLATAISEHKLRVYPPKVGAMLKPKASTHGLESTWTYCITYLSLYFTNQITLSNQTGAASRVSGPDAMDEPTEPEGIELQTSDLVYSS